MGARDFPSLREATATWHHGQRGEARHCPQCELLGLGMGAKHLGCLPKEGDDSARG